MDKIINKFLDSYKKINKKRFDVNILEEYIIKELKGQNQYNLNGGYVRLHNELMNLKNIEYIREIKSSKYNGLNPPIKLKWEIIYYSENKWDKSKILEYSDYLDFSYYKNHKEHQTEIEWEYIENIYRFLKSRYERQWATLEERSLELFYDEKFLKDSKDSTKGKIGILARLKLSYEDLKIKRYGEMFIYWNKGVQSIRNIIILENYSTFFSYKLIAENDKPIFGFVPDILIYGEGKKIEKSLSFLKELTDISLVNILYFGDFDTEGLGIYYRLKQVYTNINIKLQQEAYFHLIENCNRNYPLGNQQKNSIYLNYFLEEIKDHLDEASINKFIYIWENDFRIPQELINYEYLLKVR